MPERYTLGHHESVLRSHRWRNAENSAAYLLPHLKPGMSILDVGSGPGTITVDFAERVYPGKVVGIDASEAVVAEATRLAEANGITNVEFHVADAYDTGFEPGSFDMVHAHQVLQHLARPVDALRHWRTLVAPDGFVAARDCDYVGSVIFPETQGITDWRETYAALARHNGGSPDAGRHMKTWAAEAGFADIAGTASLWTWSDDATRDWWGGLWADRAIESEYATGVLESGIGDREKLDSVRDGWRGWRDDHNAIMFMPHGEIIARG